MNDPEQITYFAETDARNRKIAFGIKAKDRTKHVYVIGKTGMGKSTLLENMAVQDIRNGNGFAFIDPHGKTADLLLEYVPEERIKDVIYFAPFDMENPISFNVMEDVGYDKRHLVVSGLMSTFKKIWQDAWSARMEYILGNTLLALLEYPNSTLLEVNKMLSDRDFRNKVVDNITDPSVKSFWTDEFAKYTDRFAAEATPAIQNKIGQFTANPLVRNIIGQPVSSFDLRKVMDERKILIINLSKGRIGESNANLLGSMLITKLYLSALSRADIPERELEKLPNFYLYVDEFQSFANESFADILSEARKYKLNLTIAHQYIEQMSEEVRAAVFGNVGTMVTFRVGSYDAEVLEKEFAPTFTSEDIVNLGFVQIYLRLMIDGIGSHPFSARTLPPLSKPEKNFMNEIIKSSREKYTKTREKVEELIKINSFGHKNNIESKNHNFNENVQKNGGRNSSNHGNNGNGINHGNNLHNGNNGGNGKVNFAVKRINEKNNNTNGDYSKNPKEKNNFSNLNFEKDIPKIDYLESDKEDVQEISLSELTQKTQRPKDPKKPSQENKNSLKEALSAILGDLKEKENESKDDEVKDNETKSSNEDENKEKQINRTKEVFSQNSLKKDNKDDEKQAKTKTHEIPEDELRKILGLE